MEVPAAEDRRYSADRAGKGNPGRHGPCPRRKYRFKVSGVEIEGGDDPGVDFQYPWEDRPRRRHDKEMDIPAFYIDKYPVTNAQFKRFLDASGYRPKDEHNFLKHWHGGTYPQGWDRKPVTWVSLEDARAYAAWAGKRLPHEWEWQYAAQGGDGRPYPWGKEPDPAALPKPEGGRELRPPSDVDAYPKGASPWGVMDLVGNVWQWTDEYVDEHTRAAVVRGGGYYRPEWLRVVLSAEYAAGSAREISAHGPVERPFADARLPLRRRCGGGCVEVRIGERHAGPISFPQLADHPPGGDEQQRAGHGRDQVLEGDLQLAEVKIDVEDFEDQAADQGPGHADAEVRPAAEPFLLQRHQAAGQRPRHGADDQPDDKLIQRNVHRLRTPWAEEIVGWAERSESHHNPAKTHGGARDQASPGAPRPTLHGPFILSLNPANPPPPAARECIPPSRS